jgi:hypothetical protein
VFILSIYGQFVLVHDNGKDISYEVKLEDLVNPKIGGTPVFVKGKKAGKQAAKAEPVEPETPTEPIEEGAEA